MAGIMNSSCDDCWDMVPPPDMILTIPPPPMSSSFVSSFLIVSKSNRTNFNAPCTLLCDWQTGLEMREEPHLGVDSKDGNPWLLMGLCTFSIILVLAMLTTIFLLRYRQSHQMKSCLQKNTYTSDRTYESILYPSMKQDHHNNQQVLWATLNHNGKPKTIAVAPNNVPTYPPPLPPRMVSSFENDAFADMDLDYCTNRKYRRPSVSAPRFIENPNLPPLNFYPSLKRYDNPSLL